MSARLSLADRLLAALSLLLAFFCASAVAKNADAWFHLAAGRRIFHVEWEPGPDPFRFSSPSVPWVNHAWLFDLSAYAIFSLVGGAGLVVAKALLTAGLAGLMLTMRRGGVAGPAACTSLAVLAMSPRLALLSPACASYFLLGLSLYLLQGAAGAARRRWWIIVLLAAQVLWANVDHWFVLGPILAALFILGSRWGRESKPLPWWIIPALLAACLVNLHGWRAFQLPPELSPILAETGIKDDPRFRGLFQSPWDIDLIRSAWRGGNLAAAAYFLLVAGGLLSFFAARRNLQGWRVLCWLAFAALGATQVQLIPFFAVVAAPIMALNLQSEPDVPATRGPWGKAGRAALFALLPALLLLASLGWHRGFYQEGRQVAWGIHLDPSLKRLAQRHTDPLHFLHVIHPDAACQWLWLSPESRCSFDHRFLLDPNTTRKFLGFCQARNPELAQRGTPIQQPKKGITGYFGELSFGTVLLHDPDMRIVAATFAAMIQDDRWRCDEIAGNATLLTHGGFFARRRIPASLAPTPEDGPARPPRLRPLWERPFRPDPLPAWESSAATIYLRWFEAESASDLRREGERGAALLAAGLFGVGASPGRGIDAFADAGLRGFIPRLYDDPLPRSPVLPLLGIRAARIALVELPDDANAYVRLGQGIQALREQTPERRVAGRAPLLGMLRDAQFTAALEQALLLEPDALPAHAALADHYQQRFFLDAALAHRQAQLRLTKGDRAALAENAARLERDVQDRQSRFTLHARRLGDAPLAKARAAMELGLPLAALDDTLLKSDAVLFGVEGAALQLELLLRLGRAAQAGELMADDAVRHSLQKLGSLSYVAPDEEGRRVLSVPAYEWLALCQAAANGDYRRARGLLDDVLAPDGKPLRKALAASLLVEIGVPAQPGTRFAADLAGLLREEREGAWRLLEDRQRTLLELRTLAGLLALEQTRPSEAEGHLRQAVELARRLRPSATRFGFLRIADYYASRLARVRD